MSWGTLGNITFKPLGGPLDESWKASVELAEHGRIGRKPILQLTGGKLEELTLRVRLDAWLGSIPEDDLKEWRVAMEDGEVLPLVLGDGDSGIYAADWVIADMAVATVERLPGGGRIRSMELTVSLREYVEPEGLVVSQRKTPPPAVKKKGLKAAPSIVSGPGYEGGKDPGAPR